MALEDLLHAIETEADAERARAAEEAAAAAATVIERARRDADALETELAEADAAAGRTTSARERALARLDAEASVRSAREEAFASVVSGIQRELATVRETNSYPELFHALVTESRAALPTASVLRVDPRDAALAAAVVPELPVEPTLDTWGGVELAIDDGRTVRNTLEERLANAELQLRERLAQRLTPGAEAEQRSAR